MGRNKAGLGKLLVAMRKRVVEVNDQEICRRLEILMHSEKEDIPLNSVKKLIESPLDFDPREIPEPYTQYAKHYIYMFKREDRIKQKETELRKKIVEEKKKSAANSAKKRIAKKSSKRAPGKRSEAP